MHRYCVPLVGLLVVGGGILLQTSDRLNGAVFGFIEEKRPFLGRSLVRPRRRQSLRPPATHGSEHSTRARCRPGDVNRCKVRNLQRGQLHPHRHRASGFNCHAFRKFQCEGTRGYPRWSIHDSRKDVPASSPYREFRDASQVKLTRNRCLAHVNVISARTVSPGDESEPAVARAFPSGGKRERSTCQTFLINNSIVCSGGPKNWRGRIGSADNSMTGSATCIGGCAEGEIG